jgi:Flp pilus assembly protein TadD
VEGCDGRFLVGVAILWTLVFPLASGFLTESSDVRFLDIHHDLSLAAVTYTLVQPWLYLRAVGFLLLIALILGPSRVVTYIRSWSWRDALRDARSAALFTAGATAIGWLLAALVVEQIGKDATAWGSTVLGALAGAVFAWRDAPSAARWTRYGHAAVGIWFGSILGYILLIVGQFLTQLRDPVLWATIVLIVGIIGAYFGGTLGREQDIPGVRSPRRRIQRALLDGFGGAIVFGMVGAILYAVGSRWREAEGVLFPSPSTDWTGPFLVIDQDALTAVVPLAAALGGIIAITLSGVLAYGSHLALRAVIHHSSGTPWRLIQFLELATERLFLRRTGSGYSFRHRLLLEHFVRLGTPSSEAELALNLGELYFVQREYDLASAALQRAIALAPDDDRAYRCLGDVRRAQGKADHAIAQYLAADARRRQDVEFYKDAGEFSLDTRHYQEAITFYQRARLLNAHDPEILQRLGHSYQWSGESEQALTYYRLAQRLGRRFFEVHNDEGLVLRTLGQYDAALAAFHPLHHRRRARDGPPQPRQDTRPAGARRGCLAGV